MGNLRFIVESAFALEAIQQLGVVGGRGFVALGSQRHSLGGIFHFLSEIKNMFHRRQRFVAHGCVGGATRRDLLDQGQLGVAVDVLAAGAGLFGTAKDAQQRGFAGTVAPNQPDAVTGLRLSADVLKDVDGAEGYGDLFKCYYGYCSALLLCDSGAACLLGFVWVTKTTLAFDQLFPGRVAVFWLRYPQIIGRAGGHFTIARTLAAFRTLGPSCW